MAKSITKFTKDKATGAVRLAGSISTGGMDAPTSVQPAVGSIIPAPVPARSAAAEADSISRLAARFGEQKVRQPVVILEPGPAHSAVLWDRFQKIVNLGYVAALRLMDLRDEEAASRSSFDPAVRGRLDEIIAKQNQILVAIFRNNEALAEIHSEMTGMNAPLEMEKTAVGQADALSNNANELATLLLDQDEMLRDARDNGTPLFENNSATQDDLFGRRVRISRRVEAMEAEFRTVMNETA